MKNTDTGSNQELELSRGYFVDNSHSFWQDLAEGRVSNTTFDRLNAKQREGFAKLLTVDVKCREILDRYNDDWGTLRGKYQERMSAALLERRKILHDDDEDPSLLPAGLLDDTTENMPVATALLPGFWFQAMKHHPMLSDLIEPHDEAALRYLMDIEVEYSRSDQVLQDNIMYNSYTLKFIFARNPFFTDSVLTKKFICKKSYTGSCMWNDMGEEVMVAAIGTDIAWLPNKNLMTATTQRRQRNKKTGEIRVIEDFVPQNTFFNFFLSHLVPSESAVGKLSKSEVEDLDYVMEAEYECGVTLRDKIIPNVLKWYVGIGHDSDFEESTYSYEYGQPLA